MSRYRIRGRYEAWLGSLGAPLCRLLGHADPSLRPVRYAVWPSIPVGYRRGTGPLAPPIEVEVDRAVVCSRCLRRIGD